MYIYYIYIDPEELRNVRWKLLHTRTHTHTHTHNPHTCCSGKRRWTFAGSSI